MVAIVVLAMAVVATLLFWNGVQQRVGSGISWRTSDRNDALAGGDPEQGRVLAQAPCATCHGADGNSIDQRYPKLAGQSPAYLRSQLWNFKKSYRSSDVMAPVVANLTESEMTDLATFFGQQAIKPDPIQDPAITSVGERIFVGTDSSSPIAACASCHGSNARKNIAMMGGMMGRGMMGTTGMMDSVPNLTGQHARYIFDQLNHFANGQRQDPTMERIAQRLSEANRKAVAEYLSGVR